MAVGQSQTYVPSVSKAVVFCLHPVYQEGFRKLVGSLRISSTD